MTGLQLVTKFENMVQDSLDSDFVYQLLNDAKDEVEAMAEWEILKRETTYVVAQGTSYTTAIGTLPTKFALPLRMTESSSFVDYDKVDFEDRYAKVNRPFGYFIDLFNNNIFLSGTNSNAKTMYFYYTATTADLTSGTSWIFPDRFHSIIALKMAELFYAADAGEKSRSWDDRWRLQFNDQLARMHAWNDKLMSANRRPRNNSQVFSPKANI